MDNRYLVCFLYLLSLQAAAMAGEYAKEDKALMPVEETIASNEPEGGSSTDIDTTKKEEKSAVSTKPLVDNSDSPYSNPVSSLGVSGSYPGEHSPYPGHSSVYPGPSVAYPGPYSSYPGHSTFYRGYLSPYNGPTSAYPGSPGTHPGSPSAYPGSPGVYPGSPSAHPGHSSSSPYPRPSSLYPGFPGTVIPPVSTDYVSRYQGPGTIPVVLPDGTLADTPEVIAARAAHFTALQRAQALWYGPKDDGSYNPLKYEGIGLYPSPASPGFLDVVSGPAGHHGVGHSGPSATGYQQGPLVSGQQDPVSPEFQGAPVTGYQGHVSPGYQAPLDSRYQGAPVPGYQGPLAIPTVLPSGYLADTSEVVAAKLAHLGAVVRANEQQDALRRSTSHSGWK